MASHEEDEWAMDIGDSIVDRTKKDGRILIITDIAEQFFRGVWYGENGQEDVGEILIENAEYSPVIPGTEPYRDND